MQVKIVTTMRRRPSGERPPLPKEFSRADRLWIISSVVIISILAIAGMTNRYSGWLDRVDAYTANGIVAMRSDATIGIARALARLSGPGPLQFASAAIALGLVLKRRTRRLVVLLGALLSVYVLQAVLADLTQRARPFGIEILGNWAGFSFPSDTVTTMATLLFAACFAFFAKGRTRKIAAVVVLGIVASSGLAQILLGVDHPTDVIAGVMLATAVVLAFFRSLVPDALFPVARTGNAAHLDLAGPRGDAICRALRDQLGIEATDVAPFGLEGSAGSTPMLIQAGSTRLFAKLYATSHVRSDWLYKLVRTLRYGRLEDEVSFRSVRRIVEYEDYLMRLMAEAGVPVVKTYGIVEVTPEREYLLVTDFVDGASEIGDEDVVVSDELMAAGIGAVRRMWDGGLSHRDLKPSNILVKGDELIVIDVAFASVRPTPWRQAVDLANVMLVLALKTDAERVYQCALERFSREEISEAFAAAIGAAIPSQLRSMLRADARDLLGDFKALAGERDPITIQRWSLRRVGLLIGVAIVAALISLAVIETVIGPDRGVVTEPECPDAPSVILAAQAVPTAERIACITTMPSGWSLNESIATEKGLVAVFDSDRAGARALTVRFRRSCDLTGLAADSQGNYRGNARVVIPVEGGCADLDLRTGDDPALAREAESMIGWVSRSDLDASTHSELK